MEIYCKNCKSKIPASNIDSNRLIAKCDKCNSVIDLKDGISGIFKIFGYHDYPKRGEVKLPKRITINKNKFGLNITRRWFRYSYILLAFITVFWDSGVIFSLGPSFITGITGHDYKMVLFSSVFAFIGVFLTYSVLTGFVNKTYIIVNPQSLIIKHGPIPVWGNKNLNTGELKQFYSKKEKSHSHDEHGEHTYYSYDLHATTRSGKDIKLLTGLENAEQVLYLEQEIEKFLRIKDEPVEGEILR